MNVVVTDTPTVVGTGMMDARPVSCDVCSESIITDYIQGVKERAMFRVEPEGLTVCERCLPDLDLTGGGK